MFNLHDIIFILFGLALGTVISSVFYKSKITYLKTLLQKTSEDKKKLEDNYNKLNDTYIEAEKKSAELQAEKNSLQNWHSQFKESFQHLSQNILDKKSKQFQEFAEKNLTNLLAPFGDKIQDFQKTVQESYQKESRENFSLKENIKQLCETHEKLKQQTQHLSQTMKGNVKAQGQWGEMILNKILSTAGLIEGEHYITQGKGLNLKNEEKLQKPDVIIKLPDNKHIIIDSKVSLTHYERFVSAESEEDKKTHLSQFIQSLRSHVTQLSEKKYNLAENLSTPDFVLMFFPIEGAFSLALQQDSQLFQFSWNKAIVIVSPTTLLATLKTVESIWKREKQNRNAMEIAKACGRMYDKFTGFAEDLSDIGSCLNKADKSYKSAMQKLNTGQGNIVSKLEKIKSLGARTSKEMPKNILPLNN